MTGGDTNRNMILLTTRRLRTSARSDSAGRRICSWTLILGRAAVDWLHYLGPRIGQPLTADVAWHVIPDGGPSARWGRGVLLGNSDRYPFIVLPHPQARIKGDVRDRLRAEAFSRVGEAADGADDGAHRVGGQLEAKAHPGLVSPKTSSEPFSKES